MGGMLRKTSEGDGEPVIGDLRDRWLDTVFSACVDDAKNASANPLDEPHPIQDLEQQGNAGHALAAQVRFTHARRKPNGSHDRNSILEVEYWKQYIARELRLEKASSRSFCEVVGHNSLVSVRITRR